MSRMSYEFSANDLRLRSAIGIRAPKEIRIPLAAGTALYGPYIDILPGHYEAWIRFDPETPCQGGALMDVCAGIGAEQLTKEWITADEIVAAGMSAKLKFSCSRPLHGVEVRLLVDGNFSAGISSVEVSGELAESISEFRIHDEIKNPLRLIRPHAAKDRRKGRFGSRNDGGYVLLEDFQEVDRAFSFGIEQNASWDLDVAQRGLTVYQFDHTVDPPISGDARLIFAKKRICSEAGPESENLSSLIERHDKQNANPNILMKLDIEGDEWAVFDATPLELLRRFSQIVGEFHYFQGFFDPDWRQLFARVLTKLSEAYAVVHVHANNYGGFSNVANVVVPNVLEITFANRVIYSFSETDEVFPGPLDSPNDPTQPDMYLGSFRF